jgi:hypothetical protein
MEMLEMMEMMEMMKTIDNANTVDAKWQEEAVDWRQN